MKLSKFLLLFIVLVIGASFVQAADSPATDLVHQIEDFIWVITFVVAILFSVAMLKLTKGGEMYMGYMFLLIAAIAGICWKLLGVFKRTFGIENPAWLMDTARDASEIVAGILIGIAFVVLFLKIRDMKKK